MPDGRRPLRRRGGAGGGDDGWDVNFGARIGNIRSIPPRTSTGRSFAGPGSVRYAQDRYGATSVSRNHSRPAPEFSAPLIPELVEPIFDIFDEGDRILVVAEVPGADEHSIRLELEDHTLRLWARTRFKEYRGTVGLPEEARPDSLVWTLNNGVINLTLARANGKENGRRRPSGQ